MSKIPDWFDPHNPFHFQARFPCATISAWEWACRREWNDYGGADKSRSLKEQADLMDRARVRIAEIANDGIDGLKLFDGRWTCTKIAYLVQTRRQGAVWAILIGRKKRSWRQVRALLVKRRLDG